MTLPVCKEEGRMRMLHKTRNDRKHLHIPQACKNEEEVETHCHFLSPYLLKFSLYMFMVA